MTERLLRLGDGAGDLPYRWQLNGITFAIPERIGAPEDFIGRVEEMDYLYAWANRVQRGLSKGLAFLGRRKVGKTLMLERLYNILYSEHKGLIPFYYEFVDGHRSAREFYRDFITRFYMQVIGYYVRDVAWIRQAYSRSTAAAPEVLAEQVQALTFPHKEQIIADLEGAAHWSHQEHPPYEYVLSAVATPHSFAATVGVEERIVQILDEFENLDRYVDAGVVKQPSLAYASLADSLLAPAIVAISLLGTLPAKTSAWLLRHFRRIVVPQMKAAEARAIALNYGRLYGHTITPAVAAYIAYVVNDTPGRIEDVLAPKIGKPLIALYDDADQALACEVGSRGNIKQDWDEYLLPALDVIDDFAMYRIVYYVCQHEGTWYTPSQLQVALSLDRDSQQLEADLDLLYQHDLVRKSGGRYTSIFDRTLKKVLMKNYGDLFGLPDKEFDAYFKNDNMLDYLQERIEELELSLAEAEVLRQKLQTLRAAHNNLKGHDYERQVLLTLLLHIIDGKDGLVAGIAIPDFTATLNYHLETGEELDIVLEGAQVVIIAECKHYAPQHLHRLTPAMVDDFVAKAQHLHQARFPDKELRLGFFSKHGFEPALHAYLGERGVWATAEA